MRALDLRFRRIPIDGHCLLFSNEISRENEIRVERMILLFLSSIKIHIKIYIYILFILKVIDIRFDDMFFEESFSELWKIC